MSAIRDYNEVVKESFLMPLSTISLPNYSTIPIDSVGPTAPVVLSPIWLCFHPSNPTSRDLSCIFTRLVVFTHI